MGSYSPTQTWKMVRRRWHRGVMNRPLWSVKIDPSLARLAAQQDGLLTAAQIEDVGMTGWNHRQLIASGWLRKVAPRVFVVAGAPDTHRQRLRLGLLCLGDRSWISYEAAAALHGLDRSDALAVEFTIDRRRRTPTLAFTVHTSTRLPVIDQVTVNGLRTLSATRTVFDLALARSSPRRVEAAIDSAVRLELSSPEVLAARLATLRGSGRWGCRLVERLLEDAGGHTMLERRFLELVREAGLPRPRTQVVHRKNGRHIARVDFLFEEYGVVVEVSGRLGHSTPAERARDAQRRNELQDIGRRVFEYTWEDVTQRPGMVVRTLKARLHLPRTTAS
jgi:very-short-patch-repair endonuclease